MFLICSTWKSRALSATWSVVGCIDAHRTEQVLAELAALPAERYSHTPLLARIWELRHNFTCYDAAYIALAEMTESVLYTSDVKLRTGHRARVKIFTQ